MIKTLLYTITFISCGITASAQSKPVKKPTTAKPASNEPAATKKPLRFRTTWGIYLSDSIPRTEVLKLIDSPLVVRDGNNNKFPVVSFDFTYEQKEAYVNDTTNQVGFYSDFTGDSFKDSQLPQLWRSRLKETVQRGEVLFFNNIVVKYTGDKLYRVPELRVIVR